MTVFVPRIFACAALAVLAACVTAADQVALPPPPADLVNVVAEKAANGCNSATASALAAHGVTAANVTTAAYVPLSSGGENSRRTGWQAWVGLQGMPGSIVVDHTLSCGVVQVYGRDGGRLPR